MKLTEIIKFLDVDSLTYPLEDFQVQGISCDSRKVADGYLFVAIVGTKEDGHSFINEAIERGAKAVIVQNKTMIPQEITAITVKDCRSALAKISAEFYGNPSGKIKVVGITGTNGKTTVSYLIEAILKEANYLPAVIGTVEYRFKDKRIPSLNTTPGPLEIQSMLSWMLKEGADYAVMEVSSHALDQNRTEAINFHSAIFTNLTQDHLDYHETKENYFQAKAKLFKNMTRGSFVIINNDDPSGDRLKKITVARKITYGIKDGADILARDIRLDISHTEFSVSGLNLKMRLEAPLIGRHNVYNILAALAWAEGEGIDPVIVKSAVEKFPCVPGRLEGVDNNNGILIFVDYAHTEDALNNVIRSLRECTKKRVIVVFGCGGERDKTKRPNMGRAVTELADFAIITNDNPRWEDPEQIIEDIKKGITQDNYCVIPDRTEAISRALSLARKGDIILVAGKGHESYQILKDKTIPFDDRQAIRQCLKSMS